MIYLATFRQLIERNYMINPFISRINYLNLGIGGREETVYILRIMVFIIITLSGFIRHLMWVFGYAWVNLDTISTEEVFLMIVGTFFTPLGTFHGFILWFT